jgi:predicted flap endonuclease-1-like 5' DNA nuclease
MKLSEIEGIGPAYAAKLEAAGITSVEQLLEEGGSRAGREKLAGKAAVSADLLLEWVNHADLMRIDGVGSEYADLLEAAGVDSIPELAQRNAESLAVKLQEINDKKQLVRRVPAASEVTRWIAQASSLPRAVTH